ncbi:hypothetical protein AAVH_04881 [Aphelenchoides avenae]|nr:hypothetical protein AAVH_04881 [Aphelenchus avenae]
MVDGALKTVAVCLLELCTMPNAKGDDQSELRGCLRLCVNADPSLCPLVESYNLWFSLFV